MRRKAVVMLGLSLLVLLLVGVSAAGAQSGSGSLVAAINGDFFMWDESSETVTQLTSWGYNGVPVLSPDGSRFAYTSVAQIGVSFLQRYGGSEAQLPVNIWVWDFAQGDGFRVADQPPGAAFGPNASAGYVARSAPAWSPDGRQLAWTAINPVEDRQLRLVVHTLATATTQTVAAALPEQVGMIGGMQGTMQPIWLARDGGLLVVPLVTAGQTGVMERALVTYDLNGALRGEIRLTDGEGPYIMNVLPVFQNGQDMIGVLYSSGQWVVIDPLSGAEQRFSGAVGDFYITLGVNTGGTMQFAPNPQPQDGQPYRWAFLNPADNTRYALNFGGDPGRIALAPDAEAVAFLLEDGVYLSRGNDTERIIPVETYAAGLAWGVSEMRITSSVQLEAPQGIPAAAAPDPVTRSCPGALYSRLEIGARGVVTPGLPNNLRSTASTYSSVTGQIPGGGAFTVRGGPLCDSAGLTWWQVEYQGVTGWTAEGADNVYWLEPAQCSASPAARLIAGELGRVLPGESNALRDLPGQGSDSAVIGSVPAGGVFTVLSGPVCRDGLAWWYVSYQGQEGWTAEGQLSTYWLEPLGSIPPTPAAASCDLPPRLVIGYSARVLPGLPNAVRSAPGTGSSSRVTGEIPGGTIFRVTGGPTCANGYNWWQFDANGISGWTAEGTPYAYWLEPLVCGNGLPSRLLPGRIARVTTVPALANVVRSQPNQGGSSAILGEIPPGGQFTVLDGPRCGDAGRTWWRVNYNGLIGWTAEGEPGEYWLEPVQ